MAKVPLRKYNSEIESLIDRGQTDEAIAHARHILQTYPKHLETYRLLGKAYLESKRYSDATDIFNRILMAVPDDFVSHVGLSIIADEGKRLDDAIWHMERAFEKQPSNAAIQAELQRLYGRRDGREPPKIRLTRGALAHMYVQGELFPAAIAEIRAVLAEEPARTDLQSLLALAHFRGGQKVEASEICSHLLSQFPYSFDANRVLVEILPGTGMAESVNTYKQRVYELDPYSAHARASIFQTDDAPDAAVVVERLDYKNRPAETATEWDKSLAIGLGTATASAQPDWMKTPTESVAPFSSSFDTPPSPPEAVAPAPSELGLFTESSAPPAMGEEIPDWMRKAGWGESTGAFDESAVSMKGEPAAGELEKADLPDWIKSMAPAEPAAPQPSSEPSNADDTLAWLNKLGGESPFDKSQDKAFESVQDGSFGETTQPESSAPSNDAGGFPDWLSELKPPSQEAESPAVPEVPTPDWLSELGAPVAASASATADWLSKLDETPEEFPHIESPASATADWLSKLDETPEESPRTESSASATLDWLSKLDQTPEELPHAKMTAANTADWLSKLDETSEEKQMTETPAPPSTPAGLGNLGTSAAEQDAAMAWLESLAAKQGAKSEELITDPNARLDTPPEWVEQAKAVSESLPSTAPISEPENVVWDTPLSSTTPIAEPEPPIVESTPSIPSEGWVPESEEKETEPEKPVDMEAGQWSGEIELAPPPTSPLSKSASQADLPSWLRGLEAPEVESAPEPTSLESMPDWLRGEEPEVPTPPAPTRPADWTPETPQPVPAPNTEPRKAPVRKAEPKPEPVKAEDGTKLRRTGILQPMLDPMLASARAAMSQGKIPDALQVYGNLIRKGKFLEEITFDLKEALYRFPVEVSIWQALGDAYMRANRLQDALDAYTKAEELLR